MEIFHECLHLFDRYIQQIPGQMMVLFLYNFSGRGSDDCLPTLQSVRVFLPPNTTSRLQPMYESVTSFLNRSYSTVQYKTSLDYVDERSGNICNIYQLTYMKYVNSMWNEVPEKVILSFWKWSGLISTEENENDAIVTRIYMKKMIQCCKLWFQILREVACELL